MPRQTKNGLSARCRQPVRTYEELESVGPHTHLNKARTALVTKGSSVMP